MERRILDFMVHYLRSHTYQPSIREIGEHFGIRSTKTVSEHLQSLAEKGFLQRDSSRSRAVRILGVDLAPDTVSVPCFTDLPSDGRTLNGAEADLHLTLDRRLAGGEGAVFVRARPGDLALLGVQEGDYVLVEPVAAHELGDDAVVVLRLEDDSWFHRFTRNGSGARLEALRPGGRQVVVEDPDGLPLVGTVRGFYRRLPEGGPALNLTHH
jgi:repressor LexA